MQILYVFRNFQYKFSKHSNFATTEVYFPIEKLHIVVKYWPVKRINNILDIIY